MHVVMWYVQMNLIKKISDKKITNDEGHFGLRTFLGENKCDSLINKLASFLSA